MNTGQATEGPSGRISVKTGDSKHGKGGEILITSGTSSSKSYWKSFDGSDVSITAGDTTARDGTGGTVFISAGKGLHQDRLDGGRGGNIHLIAGSGHGLNKRTSTGKMKQLSNKKI